MSILAPYFKAVVGFLAPAAVSITAAVLPGSDGGTAITQAEAVTAAAACIITAAAVYAAPNRQPAPPEEPPAAGDRTPGPDHRA